MTKRTIRETVKEYDEKGNVIRETVTETTEDDDTVYYPYYAPTPYTPINKQYVIRYKRCKLFIIHSSYQRTTLLPQKKKI